MKSKGNRKIFRIGLSQKIGGATTSSLEKYWVWGEMIEEYKWLAYGDRRLKIAYTPTEHASHLFKVEKKLKMRKWFSVSQKIELFPEFQHVARSLMDNVDAGETVGIEPQYMFIETLLAASEYLNLINEEMEQVSTICNTTFFKKLYDSDHDKELCLTYSLLTKLKKDKRDTHWGAK